LGKIVNKRVIEGFEQVKSIWATEDENRRPYEN
jgi:hypothetical protein